MSAPRRHLVTGAGSGIGEALARRLVERGDDVIALARSPRRAAEMGEAVPGLNAVVADLADPGELELFLAEQVPASLDSLVHAAGVVDLGRVEDLSARSWQQQLTVNVVAPAVVTRLCLPALRAAHGSVVFVNSGAGRTAKPGWGGYAASKHALRALAGSLDGEEPDLRVSTVYPGRVATAMQEKVHEQEGKDYDPSDWVQPGTVADLIVSVLDLPRDAVVPELVVQPT